MRAIGLMSGTSMDGIDVALRALIDATDLYNLVALDADVRRKARTTGTVHHEAIFDYEVVHRRHPLCKELHADYHPSARNAHHYRGYGKTFSAVGAKAATL